MKVEIDFPLLELTEKERQFQEYLELQSKQLFQSFNLSHFRQCPDCRAIFDPAVEDHCCDEGRCGLWHMTRLR